MALVRHPGELTFEASGPAPATSSAAEQGNHHHGDVRPRAARHGNDLGREHAAHPPRRPGSTSWRYAFGRPVEEVRAIRHRLADRYAELEAAAQLVYHAAQLHEKERTRSPKACATATPRHGLSKKT
ncbi:MAG: hypothetical protein IPF66_25315 [Holophagales bacterium]|nr:hypothetical protein [Holophagales bacterium]